MPNQKKSSDSNGLDGIPYSLPAQDETDSLPKTISNSNRVLADLDLPDQNALRQNKRKNKTSPLSVITTALVFAICLASLIALIGTYTNTKKKFTNSKEDISVKIPKNLKGSVLQLEEIECGWELSPDLEKLSPPSVIVPVIKIKKTTGNDGYLQVVFKDSEGNIQGDPNTFQFISKNNSFVDQNENNLIVRSTSGLNNMLNFSSYKIADTRNSIGPWSATIMESSTNGKWSTLAIFEIPGIELSGSNQ
jgi:hypothetical protein